MFRINLPPTLGVAAVERRGEQLIIKELLLAARDIPAFARALLRIIPAREYLWRTPVLKQEEGKPFGMLKELSAKGDLFSGGYLGIAYD